MLKTFILQMRIRLSVCILCVLLCSVFFKLIGAIRVLFIILKSVAVVRFEFQGLMVISRGLLYIYSFILFL